ncbi:MAG: TraR/DksA family transcriptional regulator [Halieaceae bacterium]|jgi:DnaK suppressor protein|nr:TraR/DksA family transcriptional regulator [Halieaceae bacterium]
MSRGYGELEQFNNLLLDYKSELQLLEKSVADATEPVTLDQAKVGRLSRMDAMQAQQMALEAARRRQHQMQKIEGALRRIESGDYGDCFICGEQISKARLTADPTSTRCINCVEG